MVARFSNRLRPVNRIKHVVDFQTALPVNTALPQTLIQAVASPSLANTAEVNKGATVNGIFLTVEGVASETSTTATPNVYIIILKNPGNNLTMPNGNAVGANDNKRYVIHQEMVMINPSDGGNPRNLFKGVIAIPRGYRRFASNDRLILQLFIPSTGVAMNVCGQCHYKEFQ